MTYLTSVLLAATAATATVGVPKASQTGAGCDVKIIVDPDIAVIPDGPIIKGGHVMNCPCRIGRNQSVILPRSKPITAVIMDLHNCPSQLVALGTSTCC